jgi:hypothetical protein
MIHVRIHDLRHAHASWLLAGGADLQVVKQRLGHGSLRTTEKYLHTLPDADETALEALSKMRNGRPSEPTRGSVRPPGYRGLLFQPSGGRRSSGPPVA